MKFWSISFSKKQKDYSKNMIIEDNDITYSKDFKNRVGYQLGVSIQSESDKIVSFEGGLNIGTRGFDYSESVVFEGINMKVEQKMKLLYLTVPLTAKATVDLGNAKLYAALGPYLALGLQGEVWTKASAGALSEETTEDISWGTDENDNDLMRFDGGVHLGFGLEYKNVELEWNMITELRIFLHTLKTEQKSVIKT